MSRMNDHIESPVWPPRDTRVVDRTVCDKEVDVILKDYYIPPPHPVEDSFGGFVNEVFHVLHYSVVVEGLVPDEPRDCNVPSRRGPRIPVGRDRWHMRAPYYESVHGDS